MAPGHHAAGNLLDALACSNLATCSMPLLRQKQVPGWLQPPPLAAAHLVTGAVSPWWLCFYLSTMCPFLACSCSPNRTVICSPQLVLLLLALIASLVRRPIVSNLANRQRREVSWFAMPFSGFRCRDLCYQWRACWHQASNAARFKSTYPTNYHRLATKDSPWLSALSSLSF